MPELTIIGSSNAIPGKKRDTAYLCLQTNNKFVLIDCGTNALVRLQELGVTPDTITDIIVTHFHPDHVAGLPLLLMDLWLLGRKSPLVIHGLPQTVERIQKMMDLFGWKNWPEYFQVTFQVIPSEDTVILVDPEVTIRSNLVQHLVPTIGLNISDNHRKYAIAYTCDTEPCLGVEKLANGANILIHEAAGDAKGHSTALQAGEDAARAEVDSLVLIHFPENYPDTNLINEASSKYAGKVTVATDGLKFSW